MTDQDLKPTKDRIIHADVAYDFNSESFQDTCYALLTDFWGKADFQIKLFVFLIVILVVNLILIRIAWSIYGDRLSEMFSGNISGIHATS